MKKSDRPKQKVVEVLGIYSLMREPDRSNKRNMWVAEVRVEVRGPVYARPPRIVKRTVHITAQDELDAFKQLITEGV